MLRNVVFGICCVLAIGSISAYITPNGPPRIADLYSTPMRSAEFDDTVAKLNEEFQAVWQKQELEPAPSADEYQMFRRLTLALTGTIPSIEDLQRMEAVPKDERLNWWTDQLLADRRYADYFAERLARSYVGVEEGPFLVFRRRRFVTWLSDQLHANRPYDDLVSELITANGLWTDSPAVNFLTITIDDTVEEARPNPIRLAGRTTRAFLGVRLDCMQCHDDNLDGQWLQSDFHELAAFFSDPKPSLSGLRDKKRDYEYTYLDETDSTTVEPNVPFEKDALEPDGSRRERLAKWVTSSKNHAFARAIVNRVWALAYGRPLIEPIDSIPLEGPYPTGMETLASDFVDHQYDIKRLWRIVTSIEPYRRASFADHELTREHEDHWAAFPITRLRAEQVAGAILQSSRLRTLNANSHILLRFAKNQRMSDFLKRYGDTGEDEFDGNGGTIPQRLVILNGNLIKEVTEDNPVMNAATRIANQSKGDSEAIDTTYLAVLTRLPTFDEKQHFLKRLEETETSRKKFFEDLYWVLYNSTEFSWNH